MQPAEKDDESPEKQLTRSDRVFIDHRERWLKSAWAHGRAGKQVPPKDGDWLTLVYRSGRGFGKTAAQIEWLFNECWRQPIIGHAVAPTISDMRGTLMEGPAGFQAVIPPECLLGGSWETGYAKQDGIVRLSNGGLIRGFGATDGGSKLRGPQCHAAIGDELREWDKPAGMLSEAFSNMEFGVRLRYPDGTPSRIVCGTTPKNIPFLKNLYRAPRTIVVTGTSYENIHNLSDSYKERLFAKEGTVLGRVEIHAEDIDMDEFAIFKRSWLRLWPAGKDLPEFSYVLMSMDTAMEEEHRHYDPKKRETKVDYSACAILGIFNTKQCFSELELKRLGVKSKYAAVLCDFWMEKLGFPDLLEKSRATYRLKYGKRGQAKYPDLVLIENKSSGISLRQSLMQYGVPTAPFDPRGQSKTMRAHAASPLLLQGMLFIPESRLPDRKGEFRDWAEPLVEQMCGFSGEGSIEYDDGLDATVQAMIHLMQNDFFHAEPQGRTHPDPDEKQEEEWREAKRLAEAQKRRGINPYSL